jgi:hypothetical protein
VPSSASSVFHREQPGGMVTLRITSVHPEMDLIQDGIYHELEPSIGRSYLKDRWILPHI